MAPHPTHPLRRSRSAWPGPSRSRSRARALLPLLAALGLAPGAAWAADGERSDGPAMDWDHAPDHVVGPAVPFAAAEEPHILYVEFDGVTLTEGYPDNARENVTSLTGMAGTYVPFGAEAGDPIRAMILDEIREDFAGLWIEVTDERPAGGQYTMIVVSPSGAMPGKNGVASLNCGGSPLGVGFAFFGAGSSSVDEIATTVSHEAAHTLGIEHVADTDDIMYWSSVGSSSRFLDACIPVDPAPDCGPQHEVYCPPGEANTYRELAGLLGEPADPDGDAPQVWLVAPVEHERFELGEDVVIIAEAEDDVSVAQVKLLIDGELAGTRLTPPYEWTEDSLDEGLHELTVVARDGGGNETRSETVTIAVGDVALPDPPPDAADDADDPLGDDRLPGAGLDDAESGCACTLRPRDPRSLAFPLLLAAMASFRRTRRPFGARR